MSEEKDKGSETVRRRPRGFAAMSPERQREIASLGGKAAHANGSAHQFTVEEARVAGKIGGSRISADREHMAEIGRMGGHARGKKRNGEE